MNLSDCFPDPLRSQGRISNQNLRSTSLNCEKLSETVLLDCEHPEGITMKTVVIGGNGLIESRLVTQLREHGHETLAASRTSGVDQLTCEGLADALRRASVIVDVTNSPSREDTAVMKFFETSIRTFLASEAAAGVGRHVAL